MRFALHVSIAFLLIYSIGKAQSFTRITCGGAITLHISQGDSCSYSSSGDGRTDNSDKLRFEVYNNTLHIEGGLMNNNPVANIIVKDLKGLNINGTAKVLCDNILKCDELKADFNGASKGTLKLEAGTLFLEVNGAAQVELQGYCRTGDLVLDGAAKVNSRKCIFNSCAVTANGASYCSLDSVTNDLKVEAKGASKIYLKNIPEVYVSSRNGAGKIYEGNENHDTTIKVETKIVINDDAVDTMRGHYKKSYTGLTDADFNWTGVDLGFNGLMNSSHTLKAPAGYDYLEMNNASSLQLNLNLLEKDIKIYKRYFMGMIGVGFSWSYFKFTSPYMLQPYKPTLTAIRDSGKVLNTNTLRVSYLNVPVMLGFNTSQNNKKAFHLAFGVVTGIRLGAMLKTATDDNNGKNKQKTFALFNTEQMRYDFMIRLRYRWANIWISYNLNGLFKKNQGPEVHPVAVGVNILEF